ncbi:MAG: AAA family ATPase [Succinivibrionaceae bacterium]|nr:AAA family ATPase [Succinivibrionaceae bacterium]
MAECSQELMRTPYGEASYESFRRQRLALVDKSSVILELESNRSPLYPVLLRPRRFGKSTFVQMLKCFYDISYKDRYDEIFSGTYIYGQNLESHNAYHVLNFNFSGVSGESKHTLIDSFIAAVVLGIDDFRERYPDFDFNAAILEKKTPSSIIKYFFGAYKLYPSKKSLYIMIDEYDNFANNLISMNLQLFKEITSAGGFLKDFYAAIKDGAETCVDKTFITGVSSVSLDSLTSGFNIALNVSAYKGFNEYAGFTEQELAGLIPQLVDIKALGVDVHEIIERMRPVYDGYCFSHQAERTVYNSSMCLFYLDNLQQLGEFLPPEEYLDPASDHDGAKLKQLFGIAQDGLADEVLRTYLSGGAFFINSLATDINLNKNSKYDRKQLLSMLYYLGYLTIDRKRSRAGRLALRIPNIFMSKLFAQCTADMRLRPSREFSDSELDISALLAVSDDISTFAASCTEFLGRIYTGQVLSHMSEMALNLTLYTKLDSQGTVFAEMQKSLRVIGDGERFADLAITVNEGQDNECVYLIELKYVTKGEAEDTKIQSLASEALDQVNRYKAAIEFKERTVKAYAMIFAGSRCVYCRKHE